MKLSTVLFLTLSTGVMSQACVPVSQEKASELNQFEDFDPTNFNSGVWWEKLVNPAYTRVAEHEAEQVDQNNRVWLDEVDAWADGLEANNYVVMQQQMTPQQIATHNDDLRKILTRTDADVTGYTFDEANELYRALVSSKQVRDHSTWDPQSRIGFCFGRAMVVHAISRNAFFEANGVKESKKEVPVRKIWITGPMRQWKHHVATMVAAKEPGIGFWVIDNYVGRVTSPADWMEALREDYRNVQDQLLFNVSRANRFSEANSLRYYQVFLDDPFFKSNQPDDLVATNFFQDFLLTYVPGISLNDGINLAPQTRGPVLPQPLAPRVDLMGGENAPANLEQPLPVELQQPNVPAVEKPAFEKPTFGG